MAHVKHLPQFIDVKSESFIIISAAVSHIEELGKFLSAVVVSNLRWSRKPDIQLLIAFDVEWVTNT